MEQTRPLIAVLDDEPQFCKALARLLKTHGFEVVTFTHGEEFLEACASRLLDVHLKDVTAANQDGTYIEVGRGVIDIPRFLRTLIKLNYAGTASFEYEKDPKDPLAGLAESVGYVRGILAAL
jgi:sugar phosphate isomerase/epimerase